MQRVQGTGIRGRSQEPGKEAERATAGQTDSDGHQSAAGRKETRQETMVATVKYREGKSRPVRINFCKAESSPAAVCFSAWRWPLCRLGQQGGERRGRRDATGLRGFPSVSCACSSVPPLPSLPAPAHFSALSPRVYCCFWLSYHPAPFPQGPG